MVLRGCRQEPGPGQVPAVHSAKAQHGTSRQAVGLAQGPLRGSVQAAVAGPEPLLQDPVARGRQQVA